ncbi:MAG: hypothetical protein ABIP92_12580 [Arthrobacter sp.]
MAKPPESTKTSLQQRLSSHARIKWPQIVSLDTRFRGEYAYITGHLTDEEKIPLMRLHYGGSAARWGFAIYLASKDGYEPAALPSGAFAGAPEEALDTACGLYLDNP